MILLNKRQISIFMKVDRFCLWISEEFRFLLNYRFDSESPMALVLVEQSELWEDKLRLKRYESPRAKAAATSTVLEGSSFNRRFTSFRADWVLVLEELMPFKDLSSPVVSPPISTVMPLILFAMSVLLSPNRYKKARISPSMKAPIY